MNHKLDLQKLRVSASQMGYCNWTDGALLGWRKAGFKIPDALTNFGHSKIAIEMERTVKSRKNYSTVIYSHLRAINDGRYSEIHYWSPTCDVLARVKRAITSIDQIKIQGQSLNLDQRHFSRFRFFSLENHLSKTDGD